MASSGAGSGGRKKTSSKPASTRKSQTSGKTSKKTSKSTSKRAGGRASSKTEKDSALQDEIFLLVIIAVAVLLVLSSFNLAGSFGSAVNGFMFGMIGIVEYVLPFVAVAAVFFIIANKQYAVIRFKSAAAFVLLVLLSGMVQRIYGTPEISAPITEFYKNCAQHKSGGGLIGGLICKMLSPLGAGGTYVVLILLMLICIIIITERSLINVIKTKGGRAISTAKDDYEYYMEHSRGLQKQREEEQEREEEEYRERARQKREMREQKLEEKRQKQEREKARPKRTNNKVSGVVLNNELTDITPSTLDSGDLTEVTLDFNEETPVFDINDEYSKDIFDPDDIKASKSVQHDRAQPNEGLTEFTISDENVESASDAHSEEPLDEAKSGRYVKSDIMPKTSTPDKAPDTQPDIHKKSPSHKESYVFPPLSLLVKNTSSKNKNIEQENKKTAIKLQQTLQNFGVHVTITDISCGPAVTRYELQPEQGTKVAKIVSLSDDIKLNLAAADIRIEAPIPGKAAIGIEVPNKETASVTLRELLESPEFKEHSSAIAFAAGKDIAGKTMVADIAKMPHLLIAGATGSGKSVCINTIIMSILYKAAPDDVKLIMVDPKVVELSVYNGIPHLMIPVVTDPKKASAALNWAVAEMTVRYNKFAEQNVRDIKGYNEKISAASTQGGEPLPKMPQIVIIIDELADLMMVAPGEVEDAICRLAQLARAAGIHLVIATQRPSVNVITGLIKANVPSRIAFSVSSGVDSRTIIDMNGAEKLLGKGDMLFYPSGYPKPVRVQGAFVSDKEVGAVVDFLKEHSGSAEYDEDMNEKIQSGIPLAAEQAGEGNDRDEYFADAGRFIIEKEKASIGMLQRYFKIGFNRAARIMDQLCDAGAVGPEEGTKPRKILMSPEEFEEFLRS